ncbi:MAG: hypothetical protein AB9903_09435 [Vulcanimicrobiota bacterium]
MKIDYPESLKKLHEIREKIYEETRDLTPAERVERTNKEGREIVKKYGLSIKDFSMRRS